MRLKSSLLVVCLLHALSNPFQAQTAPPPAPPQGELRPHPVVDPTTGALGSVPAGTLLHIRLRETVSSFGSKQDSPVTAIVIQPVLLKEQIVFPLGTELRGQVDKVRRIGLGFSSETALIDLSFTGVRVPGGEWRDAGLKLTEVDNSRETVDATGAIHGIRASGSASKVLTGAAISVASLDPMSLFFGASASLSAFRIPESEIILSVGAELEVRTTTPIGVDIAFPEPPSALTGDEDRTRLTALARDLPYRTATEGKGEPSDITSIMFLGDEGDILRALDAAGWSRSDALGAQSNYGVMRSVVENQGYREGPVSTLLLAGKPPVGAWSKTLDTFFARHHLRVFAQGRQFDGKTVFVTSATHDSGIGLNRSTKTLIHLIDENIDAERGKVVDDMLLTGCVQAIDYIDRPWIPEEPKNATGDTLRTDRRMAVIKLSQCTDPRRSDDPDPELRKVRAKAIAPERYARDGFLYLRDDLYRGNIAYQGYSAGKAGYIYFHNKRHPPADTGQPRVIHVAGEPYTVVSRPKVPFIPRRGEFYDPGTTQPSFHLPGQERSYKTRLEYSVSGGYSRFANRVFSTQILTEVDSQYGQFGVAAFVQALHSGWNIAPRATIDSWRYVSNEFGYTYNKAPLTQLIITQYLNDTPDTGTLFDDGQLRQFTYNALFHARPNGDRFRPYVAVGPVFQLLRLTDSVPPRNRLLAVTVKDVGLIVDAYNFGHKPPLEGGGIFQFGFQYGAGYKFQITPRYFIRSDYRETLSPQPDYWTKSYPTIRTIGFTIGPQTSGGPLYQRLVTTGIGISF